MGIFLESENQETNYYSSTMQIFHTWAKSKLIKDFQWEPGKKLQPKGYTSSLGGKILQQEDYRVMSCPDSQFRKPLHRQRIWDKKLIQKNTSDSARILIFQLDF